MPRRRHINAGPRGRRARALLAAVATPVRDLGGFLEEHLVWRAADRLRGGGEALRWPFEQFAWLVERRLVWPLRERAAGRGPATGPAGAGALAAIVLAAGAVGVLAISTGGGGDEGPVAVATSTVVAAPEPAPQAAPEPRGPALEGVPPSFGSGGVAAEPGAADSATTSSDDPDAPTGTTLSDDGDEAAAATSSSGKPVPAGPAAMKAARRFAEAFVFYEVGRRPARARTVFEETASPRLAGALAERPPRQPAAAEVPKARVLNMVAGPRSGRVYTVSASLLRVGVTTELRLKMKKRAGSWVVTDVRG